MKRFPYSAENVFQTPEFIVAFTSFHLLATGKSFGAPTLPVYGFTAVACSVYFAFLFTDQ